MPLLRSFMVVLGVLIGVPLIACEIVFIGLNTGGGRDFLVREINEFGGPGIRIAGLGGHFPADLKLAQVSVADADGVWLSGDDLELRWSPRAIFGRKIDVSALTAAKIFLVRTPVAGGGNAPGGGTKIPDFRVNVDHFGIGALTLGPALAGQKTVLAVAGSANLEGLTKGRVRLQALAGGGRGNYRVDAGFDPQSIDAAVHVTEPPDGLLGHFAGPGVHDPFNLDLTLNGPRVAARLNFAAALGAARLDGAGTLGLVGQAPRADVVFDVPALAPFGALAGQKLAGETRLHLLVRGEGNAAIVAMDGVVALTAAPGPGAELVGPDGHFLLRLALAKNVATIQNLDVSGAGFALHAYGTVNPARMNLSTHLALKNVAVVAPGVSGGVSEDGTVVGSFTDFAVNTVLSGDITASGAPSGPFSIAINAEHLPDTPSGTLIGSGALEGFLVRLDARFARDADGAANLVINDAVWRSLNVKANLSLAAGETLPMGTAVFSVKNLADFGAFAPVPLAGGIDGNFSHLNARDFALSLNARKLVVAPSLGAIDGTVNASGPVDALAIKFSATIAKLLAFPASIAGSGVVNLDARSATIATLDATWHNKNAKLLAPAGIEMAGAKIHHLALAVEGGTINLDGALFPRLDATLGAKNLPASLADFLRPRLDVTGMIDGTAALTGTLRAPVGKITVAAEGIRLHDGPAAALPAADFSSDIALSGATANINATLSLGTVARLAVVGLAPTDAGGQFSVHLTGTTNLALLDPILAAGGDTIRGVVTPDLTISGTAAAPLAYGTVSLAAGSLQNLGAGLNLTGIGAELSAAGRLVTLQNFTATAGTGTITGHGTVDLGGAKIPVDMVIAASNATPIASDVLTETLDAALTLKGALRGALALGGSIDIRAANINIPKSLPPDVADLPIINRGAAPPPAPPPPPDVALDLTLRAARQIFIRGDGLFAELGGTLRVTGTAANPDPEGGFTLVRGNYALAGKTLRFSSGTVSFNGDGFSPMLDLEATTTTNSNTTATLRIGGTADKPTITLSATPPLPSDEVLSELLFGQATSSLSPFQAASLAAALASLSGVGGSVVSDPLGGVRNALGLDELSLGGSGSGAPSVNAGRYVAPGVYVGAKQSTTGQGTQANVQINLYKGLQLQTATGTGGGGAGASSSVGLTYQFNY